jgi:hypothetical protein
LAENLLNWPNFARIGVQKSSQESNFVQIEQNSAKIGGGMDFGFIFVGKRDYCVYIHMSANTRLEKKN